MELTLNRSEYKQSEIEDHRFLIMNGGKNLLTVEDASIFMLWAVDGSHKIKAMYNGVIDDSVIYAMLRTFGRDFPDVVREAAIRYLADCIFSPDEAKDAGSNADLKGGDGK